MNLGQNQTVRMVGKNQQIRPDLHGIFTFNVFLSFSDHITSDSSASYFWNFPLLLSRDELNTCWLNRCDDLPGGGEKKKKKTGSLRTPSEEIQTPRVTEVLIKTKKGRMLKQWEKRLLPLKFSLAWQTAEPGREVHANCHGLSFRGRHVRILSGG